ncbi:MAG: biotin synthetase [Pseudobdellovibrio sp.]|nr:biotin synthetase [Pseudobdellovibrio sp.]
MKESPTDDIKIGVITASWAEMHNISCDYHKSTTSTNDLAKDDAFNGLDAIQLYVTDEQTQGRGRGNNTWIAPAAGSSLLSSWSFQSPVTPSPYITSLIGLGLFNAARATWPFLNWNLKAPNDLYIDDKKIAGLLVETVTQGNQHRIIVGLGLNVFAHPKLPMATDLFAEMSKGKFPGVMGSDWIKFLDRLLFEICALIPEANLEPDETLQASMLAIFNMHPKLASKYSDFKTLKEDLWR